MNRHYSSTATCAASLLLLSMTSAMAGIPGGVAIVPGFHIVPAGDSEALPLPGSPADLNPAAAEPGLYDLWLFLFTRAPLVGAWTMTVALAYEGAAGEGIDVLAWEGFTDGFRPFSGWPEAGAGFRAEWRRERCLEPERYMLPGRDGWWVQPVLRLRVRAHGPDRVTFADPEPGVRPQLIECADEMHELDGTDSWTRVIPATFGRPLPAAPFDAAAPAASVTWGAIKMRYATDRP